MRFGIVVFPGTWSDSDCHYAVVDVLGHSADYLWHRDTPTLKGVYDCLILPGGFSYGDYLRPGAMAKLSPIMNEVAAYAANGRPVIGICNGFQILCESGLLPGALVRNHHLQYRCQWTNLRVENTETLFSRRLTPGQVARIPISHGEGAYYTDSDTLRQLEGDGRVVFRYCNSEGDASPDANPNGSANNIAGIVNAGGNVLGMMPHPERCCEEIMGGVDGRAIFEALASPKPVPAG